MESQPSHRLVNRIRALPEGHSVGVYRGRAYGITRSTFNGGRSFKVYAEELGGSDFVSLNYYCTRGRDLLKPCEMPEQKVVDFLLGIETKK